MYVRNCWYVAAWAHELSADELITRSIIDQAIVLYRTKEGRIAGLEDRCCHRFAPLSKGRREGDDVRCMYHGFRFGQNGVCNHIPGQKLIPPKARVKAFPVVEKHSWIWVWMGDPALADEALIPQAVGLDSTRYTLRCGQMDYQANYLLINDNLTDFSHLAYVHQNSFGSSEAWAETINPTKRIPRGIRVERWIEADLTAPPENLRKRSDTWSTYDYLAPGILLMLTAMYPPGTAQACQFKEPGADVTPVAHNFTSQAVTPTSAQTSRYFYSWGPNTATGSDVLADQMLKIANMAFGEDRVMIEAQQEVINRNPPTPQVLTVHDKGPSLMRRVLEELVAQETGGAKERALAVLEAR
jgi:phenylpropionate dioxygenase-like ring-hydroxylating dioxygenase large terminal subunit